MEIDNVKNNLKTIALLEAIISPKWEYRYFSYNSKWSDTSEMASMRNGEGRNWHLWIRDHIMAWKFSDYELGFAKDIESIKERFPSEFEQFYNEPAFLINESTCLWYFKDSSWNKFGITHKEIETAFNVFRWDACDYKDWADSYYEKDLPIKAIQEVFNGKITESVILELNPDISIHDLLNDIDQIGIEVDSDLRLNTFEKIKKVSINNKSIKYQTDGKTYVKLEPKTEGGFTIMLNINNSIFTVSFDGWHEEFENEREALNCISFGLSDKCRLKTEFYGKTPTKWMLESKEDGKWIQDSSTGLIFKPFWKKKSVRYFQNSVRT